MSIIISAMYDDEEPHIHFSEGEKPNLPEEALSILISSAKQCYRLLNPAKLGIDMHEGITIFIHSVDCAMQVVQHRHRAGSVNLAALAATIDLPHIEDTLPILLAAFEEGGAFWKDDFTDHVAGIMFVLAFIGAKLYPGGLNEQGVQGYRDIFDDKSSGSSNLTRLYP